MLRFDERVHLPKNRENTITFLVNGEPIGTVETLAPGAKTVDIPIPPVDYDSVIDALGYVPQEVLVSGSNIKTINNTSLLGSGNIDIQGGGSSYTAGNGIDITNDVISIDNTVALKSDIPTVPEEVFIAEYGRTTYQDVLDAYNAGKAIYAKRQVTSGTSEIFSLCSKQPNTFWFANPGGINQQAMFISPQTTVYTLDARDTWDIGTFTNASNTLSNVVTIDASSAVQTALDDKVSKAGDTMSGRLHFASNSIIDLRETFKFEDVILGTIPSETHFSGFQTFDSQDYEFANVLCSYNSDGRVGANFYVRKPISGGSVSGSMGVYINAQDEVYSTFPHTECVDGQWVYKNTSLGSSVTWNTSSHRGGKNYSLSSYLPNDGQKYEVIVRAQGTTTSTSGKFIAISIFSDILTAPIYVCRCKTRSSSTVNCSGNVVLPVGTGRKITVAGAGSEASADGTYDIACIGYRRIGTNS